MRGFFLTTCVVVLRGIAESDTEEQSYQRQSGDECVGKSFHAESVKCSESLELKGRPVLGATCHSTRGFVPKFLE